MKREAGFPQTASEDKRARFQAGLDLNQRRDITDLQVENIIKEVSAPASIQKQLDEWIVQLTELITNTELAKGSKEKLTRNVDWELLRELEDGFKFPGGKVSELTPLAHLAARSLVFPSATATIRVDVAFKKSPKDSGEKEKYLLCSLARLYSQLASSTLVSSVSLARKPWTNLPTLAIKPAVPKLKTQLKIILDISPEEDSEAGGISNSLQDELIRLQTSHQNYKIAAQLMEIWRRQLKSLLPVNLFPVVFLHCHLTNQLAALMTPWQIVRKVWTFLSEIKYTDHQIILGVEKPVPSSENASLFLDRDGSVILFPEFPASQCTSLASWAEAALSSSLTDTLLVNHTTCALYDTVLCFKGGRVDPTLLLQNLDYAFGDRVSRLSGIESEEDWEGFTVGLNLNPTNYHHPATQGPEPDSPNAAKFRRFWGERSELRRFQDGAVKEVVVWGNRRDEIMPDMARAVAARHHPGVEVVELGGGLTKLLVGDGGETARQELDVLTPVLYDLEDIPLKVSGVSCFGQEYRLSKVGARPEGWKIGGKTVKEKEGVAMLLQKIGMSPKQIDCVDVMLQAAHSGKWPKDSDAVRRLRVAWLNEVGKALSKQVPGLKYRIVGENLIVVPTSQQVVFRFCVGEKGKEHLGHLCQFTSWLGGLAKTNQGWSGGVRLAKRWVSAHLLNNVLTDTAVEVIMARIFTNPGEFGSPPVSPVSAFLRFLQLVSSHDWNEGPLLVDPQMSNSAERASLPPLAVISPHDPSPSYWTKPGPSWTELQRLVIIAATTIKLAGIKTEDDEVKRTEKLFVPSLESYEFLIHLKPLMISNRSLAITKLTREDATKKDAVKSGVIPVMEFNPALLLLSELNQSYSHLASFHYDSYGGDLIAVKLKQNLKSRVKVTEIAGHINRGCETEVNWGAVVEDWRILGDGVVKHIHCADTTQFI